MIVGLGLGVTAASHFVVSAVAEVIRKKIGVEITGSSQIDIEQYKFGGASGYFPSSLIKPQTQFLTYGTDNWTFEAWFRLSSLPSTAIPISTRALNNTLSAGEWQFVTYSTGQVQFNLRNLNLQSSTGAISANTWFHVAVVRNSNSWAMYINGSSVATGSESGSFSDKETFIGGTGDGSFLVTGHIDELRISNTARYTTGFTPSTTPFVNDENTLLLLHMDGTDASTVFEDDNGVRAKVGVTAIGNAQVDTAQSKFGGASYLGDGSGDRLRLIGQVLDGEFTVEYWFRAASFSNQPTLVDFRGGGGGQENYSDYITSGGVWTLFMNSGNRIQTSALSTNTWYHIAVVRDSSNDIKLYLNGVKTGNTYNYSGYDSNTVWLIGDNYLFTSSFNGHIDELRVSNTARYTTGFTPQTAPFVNDANTLLLIHADGTDGSTYFEDDNGASTPDRTQKHISYYGNAQIDTAQSKFGGSSALFDGTGDYLSLNPVSALTFGTNNFTIEGWYRAGATNSDHYIINFKASTSNISGLYNISGGFGHWGINIYIGNWRAGAFNNKLVGGVGSGVNTGIDTTTWHHFALVRDSSTSLKYYIDGTQIGSTVTLASTDNFTSTEMVLGTYVFNKGAAGNWNGHLDELRISNIARYTSNFTPSTTAFTNDENTLLLLHFDGKDASTVFLDDVGGRAKRGVTAVGNAQIDTAQYKFGGTSALFDGNEDYMIIDNPIPSSGDFTVEFWLRLSVIDAFRPIWSIRTTSGTNRGVLYVNQGGLTWWNAGTNLNSSTTLSANTWYHIACVIQGNAGRLFVNGSMNTATFGINRDIDVFQIGKADYSSSVFSNELPGHIDEFRVSNTARYTEAFTPSTTPFQNDSNTLLLLHMDGTDGSTVFTDDNGVPPDYDYGA